MIACAFGPVYNMTVDFEINGKMIKMEIADALAEITRVNNQRLASPHIIFFPYLAAFHIFPKERANYRNTIRLKDLFRKIVRERKIEIKRGIDTERGDLLSMLLSDEYYQSKDSLILDECIALY
jgi:cytochrome P450